jgi:hypothetical protein
MTVSLRLVCRFSNGLGVLRLTEEVVLLQSALCGAAWRAKALHFNCLAVNSWGRNAGHAGPPPAVAALWALQVRPEYLAAAGLEVGMWPV